MARKPAGLRLWAKTDRNAGEEGCWLWLGAKTHDGYGRMSKGIRGEGWWYVHRLSWELVNGPIPQGLFLDHLCRVRNCVNPLHLEVVTTKENVRRGMGHGKETQCPAGHPYDEANTYIDKLNRRRCRMCMRVARRERAAIPPERWRKP
jgi:hypothetical protein